MIRLYHFTFSKLHFYLTYGENRFSCFRMTCPALYFTLHQKTLPFKHILSHFPLSERVPLVSNSHLHFLRVISPGVTQLILHFDGFSQRTPSSQVETTLVTRPPTPDIFSTYCFLLVAEPSLSFEVWLLGEAVCSHGLSPSGWRQSDSGFQDSPSKLPSQRSQMASWLQIPKGTLQSLFSPFFATCHC